MSTQKTKKETIEYNREFLKEWNSYCTEKGYSKRQASHAAAQTFMEAGPDLREEFMASTSRYVTQGRDRLGSRSGRASDNEQTVRLSKETIEYDINFLEVWSDFCNRKGYVKRHAAVAARKMFMGMSAEDRERFMEKIQYQGRSRAIASEYLA
jgi:hypothetical protein